MLALQIHLMDQENTEQPDVFELFFIDSLQNENLLDSTDGDSEDVENDEEFMHGIYAKYSWEKTLLNCFISIEKDLLDFLSSTFFQGQYIYWNNLANGLSQIYYKISEIIFKNNRFPLKTKKSSETQMIIYKTLISQLHLMKKIQKIIIHTYGCKETLAEPIIKSIVKESVWNSVEFWNLADEYKHKWHAAEKIQQTWRTCISNPSYEICQKRLMKEFQQLI